MSLRRTSHDHRPARVAVHVPRSVSVRLLFASDPYGPATDVELHDLSTGGAKLRSPMALPVGTALSLLLAQNSGRRWELSVPAQVRWTKEESLHSTLLGCAFTPPLDPHKLADIYRSGVLDRRAIARDPVQLTADIDVELGPRDVPVTICDLSQFGFGCLTDQAVGLGVRVRLRFPNQSATAVGMTVWRHELSTGWLIGCVFTDRTSYHILREQALPVLAPSAFDETCPGEMLAPEGPTDWRKVGRWMLGLVMPTS